MWARAGLVRELDGVKLIPSYRTLDDATVGGRSSSDPLIVHSQSTIRTLT